METTKRKAASPELISELYGIPIGSLANMRFKREGPRFFKAGKRKVVYFIEDVEDWLRQSPIQTTDSIKIQKRGGEKHGNN